MQTSRDGGKNATAHATARAGADSTAAARAHPARRGPRSSQHLMADVHASEQRSWIPLPLCATGAVDPDWFFASRGTPEYRAAKALCARCPLRATCADFALRAQIPYGLFGGLDGHDRALRTVLARRRAL